MNTQENLQLKNPDEIPTSDTLAKVLGESYHAYEVLRSSVVKVKYRHDQRIVFLENFHIRFHQMRIKCIARSFTKYKAWARQVAALKHRLNT